MPKATYTRLLALLLAALSVGAAAQAQVPARPAAPPSLDNPLNRNPARRASQPSDAAPPLPSDGRDSTTRPTEAAAPGLDPARDSPATLPATASPTIGTPQPAL